MQGVQSPALSLEEEQCTGRKGCQRGEAATEPQKVVQDARQ